MKCSLGISNFLEELSSRSHSVVFLYFFYWSLRKAFLSLPAILWNSAFKWVYFPFLFCFLLPFFSQLFVRPPQTAILLFCISFSWGWSCSLSPVQCLFHYLLFIIVKFRKEDKINFLNDFLRNSRFKEHWQCPDFKSPSSLYKPIK